MQQKKLLMISTDRKIFQEGSGVRLRQAEYAKNWGEVHIIVFDKKVIQGRTLDIESREIVIAPNCWVYSTASKAKFMYPFDAMKLGRFIIERRGITDISCQDPFLTAMAGVALKKQFPMVHLELQVHTDIGSPYFTYSFGNKMRKFLALNYLPKADHVRVVSERVKKWIQDSKFQIQDSNIKVRPIFVDTDTISRAPILEDFNLHKKYPQFEKIVLMASRLEKEKNVELAIRAWAEVVKKLPKVGLIIVGAGREKIKLEKMASPRSDLGLGQKIVFEAWVDQPTLISYYKTADLFLNTSLFEGYGMTLVEAKSAGCMVVSTDVGVAREVGAEIIPWDNQERLAEVVVACLNGMKN